ncbi:MAG: glucose-1-phosphate adenylyltransferase family protein [Pyrinomonadaceae bacterium]
MARNKVLALILAGGAGSRLDALTEERAKPVLPFAGVYRLIDFALSNCMHSGIPDVWIIEQYLPHSLNDHLANGRPWDLDRTYGGLKVLPPFEGSADADGGFAEGNADAIYRHKDFIREFAPDILLVLSADHIYKLDFGKVIEHHLERNADVTMVTTRVPIEDASRFGTIEADEEGRVTNFAYKIKNPTSDLATTEVFVYNAHKFLETLDQLAAEGSSKKVGGDKKKKEAGAKLKDFGNELLPRLVKNGRAFEYRFTEYWRDVGTVESYWQSHMDLLEHEPLFALDDPRWPILTYGSQRLPARIHKSARIENSLIAPGCTVRGHVIDSVLAPGVVIEAGAVVSRSVLLHNTIVAANARIDCAILDEEVHVEEKAVIGKQSNTTAASRRKCSSSDIALIGRTARIPAGKRIAAGARIKSRKQDHSTKS